MCREVLSERTEDDRDITAEINFLMSLEAPDDRFNFLAHPHEEEDRGMWANEIYSDTDFYDDVNGRRLQGDDHQMARRQQI